LIEGDSVMEHVFLLDCI